MIAYLASLMAAWAGMGMFCLRSHAIRSRYGWPHCSLSVRRWQAMIASLFCLLSLVLLLKVTLFSFALILWLVQLGVIGISIALLLPYFPGVLPLLFRGAGVLVILVGAGYLA